MLTAEVLVHVLHVAEAVGLLVMLHRVYRLMGWVE